MTHLSINLNKIALLRNQRDLDFPSVLSAASTVLKTGATGITVHPRPDQRHTTIHDVEDLRIVTHDMGRELNVEGNPQPDFLDLIYRVCPDQVTLVPDEPSAKTSDHGWDLSKYHNFLLGIIAPLQRAGMRVSIFVDHDSDMALAKSTGADAVELYTEPFARAYAHSSESGILMAQLFADAAHAARQNGLFLHAGHDINLENLPILVNAIRGKTTLDEVSIGHAFTAEALWYGMESVTKKYLNILR